MTISKNDIKKIAYLARIKISQEESILLEKKLTSIMDLIDEMQKVNTDGVEPMSHALDVNQPLRKDNITELDLRKKTMPLAPEVEKSLFIVPQVIE
jgi:aspartyl-tRNA(Asn)/glutamyl-tRNA(Gln) amidotransferase subunit C